MDDEDYVNIEEVKIIEHGVKLLGIATVSFLLPSFDIIFINFFIWRSSKYNERLRDYVNISPPTLPGYKTKPVWIKPEKSWEMLEGIIYEAYTTAPRKVTPIKEESNKEEENN